MKYNNKIEEKYMHVFKEWLIDGGRRLRVSERAMLEFIEIADIQYIKDFPKIVELYKKNKHSLKREVGR